jgi:ABC-type transport system substrate-binding protein
MPWESSMKVWAYVCLLAVIVTALSATSYGQSEKTLLFRINHFDLNMDPATLADIESRKIATLLHAGLVAIDIDGKIYPRLAESWTKRGESTWVFKLKKNVRFTDGKPADARAVVNSLCWSMQPSHLYSWALSSIDHKRQADGTMECKGIWEEDERTVVIRESKPVPWFLESLDGPAGWIVGNPGEKPAAWGVRPGVGSFQLGNIKTNDEIELHALSDGALVPNVDRVLFRYVLDPLAATRMFQQGELDLLRVENPDMLRLLKSTKAKLIHHKFQRFRVIIVNRSVLKKKGFSEEQVQAFIIAYSAAVDRERIAKLSDGLAQPMYTAFPPAADLSGYFPNHFSKGMDKLPQARLTLLTINDAYSDLIAGYLPNRIEKVKIDYRAVESSLLVSALFKGEADLISMLIDATSSSPVFWASFWTPGSTFVGFGTPIQRFSELDFVNKEDILIAAKAVDQYGNWIGILKETGILAVSPRLKGLRLTPSGQVSLESVSFASN